MTNSTGIITFHRADNHGAVLQAYALQKTLEEQCGVHTQIIDYCADKIEETKQYKGGNQTLRDFVKSILISVYYRIKHKGFEQFRKKYLHISQQYDKKNIAKSNNYYDIFITGSDQVWNLECSGFDYTYFLDFVSDDKKRYSYAASIGNYKFTPEEKEIISDHIKNMNAISVREKSALDELAGIDKDMSIHPDPVMLLSEEEYKKIMSKRLMNRKYVFVYLIQEDVNVLKKARQYAKENGCKIINNKSSIEFILHNSPAEFLSWIYYADAVFTNSFHGTAFSLIFNKKLAADTELTKKRINSRVDGLLDAVDARQCIIGHNESVPAFAFAANKITAMKVDGVEYLTRICNCEQVEKEMI